MMTLEKERKKLDIRGKTIRKRKRVEDRKRRKKSGKRKRSYNRNLKKSETRIGD